MSWSLPDFLWLAAGLTTLWVCLPMILNLLGCTRVRNRVLPPDEEIEPAGEDEAYLFYRRQLEALGFKRLGAIEEKAHFLAFHYVKRFRYRVFVSRERGVYASLSRSVPGDKWRVSLSTLLHDGWLIQTACRKSSLEGEKYLRRCTGEKYFRGGVTTRVVAEQLEAHLEQLRARGDEGDKLAAVDLAALARRINEVGHNLARSGLRLVSVFLLGIAVFVLSGLAGLGWLVSPGRHLLVPAGLLLGGLLYRPLLGFLLRRSAQRDRRDDEEKRHKEAAAAQPADGPPLATPAPSGEDGVKTSPTDYLGTPQTFLGA
jgi:hypothetical protein